MAIEGPIKELSLFELFQLISFAKKTGQLKITTIDGYQYFLYFREGFLIYLDLGEKIINELQKRGMIDSINENKDLESLLVENKLDIKEVSSILKSLVENEIFTLLKLKDGFFNFEEVEKETIKGLELHMRIENLIMEGARRIDETERLLAVLPPDSTILSISEEIMNKNYISLTSEEWEILSLIDGKKSIKDIIKVKGNEFKTIKALYGLYMSGLLKKGEEEEHKEKISEEEIKYIDKCFKEKKFKEGIEYMFELSKKYEEEPTLLYNLGYFHLKVMDFKNGLSFFEKFLKVSRNRLAIREIEEIITGIKSLVEEIMKLEGEIG